MTGREGTIDSDGVAIHYRDWGGRGPPLILLHATGFLAALWQPVAERLAGRFRVVTVDQRGHGDSGKPPDGYRFETFAGDLQRLIEGLALERPLAAGHSAGATIIVAHTAKHPGVIRRVVLIEPILPRPEWYAQSPIGDHANSLAEGARNRRAVWPSHEALFRAYRSRRTFETWREDVLRLYVEEGTHTRDDGQVELKCPPEIEAQVFDAARYVDPWPMLAWMECPALVVWGRESHLLGLGIERQVEDAIPQVRTVVVPGTTHFLPQERPDEVARLTEEFLSDRSTELSQVREMLP
jgi:pimeloyl-ACP methyl ester carboxylesterase